ncbi:low temperature requirement protein A [uncultured Aurantimicrobium sp.]|uniref:low temperature requirement protein A n=1 Tax=uncultured Aurantimicrobium sp. TaxID=1705357 RepID=UPI00261E5A0B|nr:low temperature requirement protein A [uncultured Aurantimicrobium sp.]
MLFYDLVVAAAFGLTTEFYSDEPTWGVMGFILVCNLFLYLLWILTSLELLSNSGRNAMQKLFGLLQIISLSLMSISLSWDSALTGIWGLLGVGIAVLSLVGLILSDRNVAYSQRIIPWLVVAAIIFFTGSALSALGVFTDESAATGFFIAGVAVMLAGSAQVISQRISEDSTLKIHEFQERFGMLLLIVLGEAFIFLVNTLGAIGSIPQPLFFVLVIVVVFSIWLMYFPKLAQFARPESVRHSAARFAAHFVLVVCSANAVAAFASQTILTPIPGVTGWSSDNWTALPLVALLLALIWLHYLDELRWTKIQTVHLIAAAIILILSIAGADDNYDFGSGTLTLSALVFLGDALVSHLFERKKPIPV